MISEIFILSPGGLKSGGSECLHQLCSKLNDLGYHAFMYYFGPVETRIQPDSFTNYNIKIALKVNDNPENIIIVPETYAYLVNGYKRSKRVIFWLSIDFFYKFQTFRRNRLKSALRLIRYPRLEKMDHSLIHFCQSEYAYQYLQKYGIQNLFRISDYLIDDFSKPADLIMPGKKNMVAFNPKKGFHLTEKLIQLAPEISWVRLENMTRSQVIDTLSQSKVYIDFGNHPGKDRIPREAALMYNCVITNREGSANFFEDVPIPDKYKFIDPIASTPEIMNLINRIFSDFQLLMEDFHFYRTAIHQQEFQFIAEVKSTFEILTKKCI
ncbi:MAG: hypothetical protein PHF97_07275 [Bacteroidales bacterium]|nr:hypothetical protein [Bacteroidales bacterium]